MTKQELVEAIAKKTGATKALTQKMLEALTSEIVDAVCLGQRVQLIGFGTFAKAHRAARNGRNPSTGAITKFPAKEVPKFVPGKAFKDAVEAAAKKPAKKTK